jgi:hypothetical protein
MWFISKSFRSSHLTLILVEFVKNLTDIPAEHFERSQTGPLTLVLYDEGNLSKGLSLTESAKAAPSIRKDPVP